MYIYIYTCVCVYSPAVRRGQRSVFKGTYFKIFLQTLGASNSCTRACPEENAAFTIA